jgi:hypothetical protein
LETVAPLISMNIPWALAVMVPVFVIPEPATLN